MSKGQISHSHEEAVRSVSQDARHCPTPPQVEEQDITGQSNLWIEPKDLDPAAARGGQNAVPVCGRIVDMTCFKCTGSRYVSLLQSQKYILQVLTVHTSEENTSVVFAKLATPIEECQELTSPDGHRAKEHVKTKAMALWPYGLQAFAQPSSDIFSR